jgi:hypothetical protein
MRYSIMQKHSVVKKLSKQYSYKLCARQMVLLVFLTFTPAIKVYAKSIQEKIN